jgi:hypothetical protein
MQRRTELVELKRNRVIVGALARKVKVLLGATLVTAALTACGGGDDTPVAAAVTAAASGTSQAVPGVVSPVGGSSNGPVAGAPATGQDESVDEGGTVAADESVDAPLASAPGATTLSWTPPTLTEDGKPLKLKGYRIYWGPMEGYYPYSVTVKNPGLTRYVVEELAPATWYFVATALSDVGESEFSNVIAMRVR